MAGIALIGLALLVVVAVWAFSGPNNPLGTLVGGPTATPLPPPTSTPAPTSTPQPGIGITIPGPQGTPTTIPVPLPIPPIPGISGTPNITIPIPSSIPIPSNIPIPGANGTPGIQIPILGASGTQPPGTKLTADDARQKVKDSLGNCRLLQGEISLAEVTFEPPDWVVKLVITGGTWRVNDDTGAVTPDQRATERQNNCRV